jgi:hypothetical protein
MVLRCDIEKLIFCTITKKIDEYEHAVIMQDTTKILIDDIFEIDGEL